MNTLSNKVVPFEVGSVVRLDYPNSAFPLIAVALENWETDHDPLSLHQFLLVNIDNPDRPTTSASSVIHMTAVSVKEVLGSLRLASDLCTIFTKAPHTAAKS